MHSSKQFLLLVVLLPLSLGSFLRAQEVAAMEPHIVSATNTDGRNEVEELRREVAEQRRMIRELQNTVQQLIKTNADGESAQPYGADNFLEVAQTTATTENRPPEKKEKAPQNLEFTIAGTKVQFYGHADLSYDYVTNGISSAQEAGSPILGAAAVPLANNGWISQVSSNLSYFGIRGSRAINPFLTGVFQLEAEVNFAGTPGSTSDNQCRFCLGSRDSFVGIQGRFGSIKIGKEDAPYKKASSPLDPFIYTIGDNRSIMGNSGGDNRAEFATRLSHSIWYDTPTLPGSLKGVSWSILVSPGENRSTDDSAYARGEPNCSGGNGAFVLSSQNSANVAEGADLYAALGAPNTDPCNDGSWGTVVSTALSYRGHGLYTFAGYEHHAKVNRLTDLVGFGDEAAWKGGIQYAFSKTGTTGNFIYENLKRYGPGADPRLNERSRPLATWTAITQKLTSRDEFSVGWAHAGRTPGDPGFCAPAAPGNCAAGQDPNTAPFDVVRNSSNLYDIGFRHRFSPRMTSYFVYARQQNARDAHYDLGAVGHGIQVDKRDFLGTGFPGTRLEGISAGMTFDF
jgi:predicted porin